MSFSTSYAKFPLAGLVTLSHSASAVILGGNPKSEFHHDSLLQTQTGKKSREGEKAFFKSVMQHGEEAFGTLDGLLKERPGWVEELETVRKSFIGGDENRKRHDSNDSSPA
jgi:hypothetical protein